MEEMDQEFVIKTSKKKIIAIILIIIFSILSLSGIIFYNFFVNVTSSSKFLDTLSIKLTDFSSDLLENIYDIEMFDDIDKTYGKQTGNIVLNSKENLSDYKINYEMSFNNSLQMSLYLNLLEQDKSLLDGTIYLDDDIYLMIPSLYDKYLKLDSLNKETLKENKDYLIKTKDLQKLSQSLINYSFEAFKECSSNSKNLNFQEIKYTYELTTENIPKIKEKYKELITKDMKLEETDISFPITLREGKVEMIVNRFTKKITKIEITSNDKKIKINQVKNNKYNIASATLNATLEFLNDKLVYKKYEKNEVVETLEINKIDSGLELIEKTKDINFKITLKEVSDSKLRLALTISDFENDIKIDLDGDILKLAKNKYNTKFLTNLKVSKEEYDFTLESEILYGETLNEEIDFTNNISINDLSDTEKQTIILNLIKKLEESKLLNSFVKETNQAL